MKPIIAIPLLFVIAPTLPLVAAELPAGYQLQFEENFKEPEALQRFVMTDPGAWRHAGGDTPALELHRQSRYKPEVRSPLNIALIADKVFDDFVMELRMKQTGREYGHRDMCLFFDVQDPSNFYYSHIATRTDDHAHNVFIVKEAPRTKISTRTTQGVRWGVDVWHTIRLERTGKSIKVYFDDLTAPIMEAEDDRFRAGYVGFGSFDDVGQITDVRVWAPTVKASKTTFYKRP